MNNKIKVIELINKIYANDVPEKIKFEDREYQYDEEIHDYRNTRNGYIYLFEEILKCEKNWLDTEVEILEDEEEIDIQDIDELQIFSDSTVYDYNDIDINRKVINDLVKAVKQLDKKINKE